jgi:hypothetical protein
VRPRASLAGLRVTVAALIIWGMKDTAFRPINLPAGKGGCRALPSCGCRQPVTGHRSHEESPSELVAAIRGFLEG